MNHFDDWKPETIFEHCQYLAKLGKIIEVYDFIDLLSNAKKRELTMFQHDLLERKNTNQIVLPL